MDAVIIAGGLGTRLYPLTLDKPKSCVPLLDAPIIAYVVEQAKLAGCRRIAIACGHLASHLKQTFDNHPIAQQSLQGVKELHFVEEDEPLGTGGALVNAVKSLGLRPPLLVLNGDVLTNMDMRKFAEKAGNTADTATIVAVQVADPSQYGMLVIERDNTVTDFIEKGGGQAFEPPFFVNGGIYCFNGKAFDELMQMGGAFSLERELFPKLTRCRLVKCYKQKGFWRDVGTLESYFRTQFDILGIWLTEGRQLLLGQRSDYALFKDFIYINRSAQLGEGSDLFHRVILMRDSHLGRNCRLQNTILLPGANIEDDCKLTSCIVDSGVRVEKGRDVFGRVLSKKKEDLLAL